MNILEVKEVSKSYKDRSILENISFNVDKGEILGLVGPNGAGKTTIFKMISGLIKKDKGEIIKKGEVSGIISKTPVYPFLSGKDHLEYIVKLNNKNNLNEVLEFIGIGKKINEKVSTYSLGMKQRLCIGIVLLNDPDIILLDEPTNGLDNEGINDLRLLLRELSEKKKKTIIIASHNLREIELLSNRIIVINAGKIVKVLDREKKINGENFIIKFNTKELSNFKSYAKNLEVLFDKNVVTIRASEGQVREVLKCIIESNIVFTDLEIKNVRDSSLEKEYNLYINEGAQNGTI
ncbi:MAG: ABC transporter ATP-binding protein [Clostridium sp.]